MATTAHRSSAKFLALSAAAISTGAAVARVAAPPLLSFAAWGLPRAYASARSWLTPPYLYVVLNGIIITIAASSRFQKGGGDGDRPIEAEEEEELVVSKQPEMPKEDDRDVRAYDDATPEVEKEMLTPPEAAPVETAKRDVVAIEEKAKVRRLGSGEMPMEISDSPTVSARFGGKRTAKSSSEVKPLGVARPRRSDTLESTWRMITDGRSVPLARHLKKSETWETHNAKAKAGERRLPSDVVAGERRAPLRREPSLGQEELNRRVESFIQKFNEEMRIQRQESLQRYWDLVNGRR